jgi:hypothetical protein
MCAMNNCVLWDRLVNASNPHLLWQLSCDGSQLLRGPTGSLRLDTWADWLSHSVRTSVQISELIGIQSDDRPPVWRNRHQCIVNLVSTLTFLFLMTTHPGQRGGTATGTANRRKRILLRLGRPPLRPCASENGTFYYSCTSCCSNRYVPNKRKSRNQLIAKTFVFTHGGLFREPAGQWLNMLHWCNNGVVAIIISKWKGHDLNS